MYDIIIIGAGPAGLTSAIYARIANKKVLLLEAKVYGGQIVNTLEIKNYPSIKTISGFDYATNLYSQAMELGAEIKFEKAVNVENYPDKKVVETRENKYEAKTIIIATGCERRKLSLPNERELTGRGISYCATCDGSFYKDKTIAVVGGGLAALEDALYLSDIAKKIYLIYRGDSFNHEIIASKVTSKPNIFIMYNSNIKAINGTTKLESIDVVGSSEEVTLEVDGLFIAVGQIPENENFRKLIDMDDRGYIIAGEDCKTSCEGIFVAGDSRIKTLRQLVTATSDGAVAATNAIKYINTKLNN